MSPSYLTMKFIWTKTGDYLTVDISHPPLVEHWLNQLPSNRFIIKEDHIPYTSIDRLYDSISRINELFTSKLKIFVFDYKEITLDQNFLNCVHSDWATVHHNNPGLPNLLAKLGDEYLQLFYDINLAFHSLESHSKVKYVEQQSDTMFKHQVDSLDNICDYLHHGVSQLSLEYWSLGRDDYDAWIHGDTVAKITNFDKLPYTLDVKLKKPYTSTYPEDYVQWMHKQGKQPIGSYLPIGNFKGYTESVGNLYEIFVKNNKIEQTVELVL